MRRAAVNAGWVLFLSLAGLYGSAQAATASPLVTLDYPNGGQVFVAGSTQQVRLGPKPKVAAVNVELSTDGGTTFVALGTITVTKLDTPSLSFTVPNTPSTNCVIRVTGSLKGATTATVSSAPFAIFATFSGAAAIPTSGLADGSVTNPKIATGAVSNDKVTSGAASNNFVLTADGAGQANWQALTPLSLPVAGTTPATIGVSYADNSSVKVGPDGKLSVIAAGVPLAGEVTGAASSNVVGNAVSANIANAIVRRDASGNFSAGTITGNVSGTAANVTGTVAIANGGTGQTTANAAFNALSPSQATNAGKILMTDGTNSSWVAADTTLSANVALRNSNQTFTNANKIAPTTDVSALIVNQTSAASPTKDIFDVTDKTGTAKFLSVDPNGTVNAGSTVLIGSAAQSTPVLQVQDASGNVTFAAEARPGNSGTANTFVGLSAGSANTIAGQNTFVGNIAGASNTTGDFNTFVGQRAGFTNTSGGFNAFFGMSAGLFNTGSDNTFVGMNAGQQNTDGFDNTFVGQGAGVSNLHGFQDTFVGRNAGSATTGNFNTFIGESSGTFANTSDRNTLLGHGANISAAITNATAIGADATVGSSNTVVLGNACTTVVTGALNVPAGVVAGTATLNSSTVTVTSTAVTANSVILVSYNTFAGTSQGILSVNSGSINAGAHTFVITSTGTSDSSTVNWWIVN